MSVESHWRTQLKKKVMLCTRCQKPLPQMLKLEGLTSHVRACFKVTVKKSEGYPIAVGRCRLGDQNRLLGGRI